MSPARRLHFIDSVRGLAVFLAMLSHATGQFTDSYGGLLWLTRTATPAFMVLFGIMLELAYLRKLRETGDAASTERRLISRMITCYLMFVAITLAGWFGGKLDFETTVKAVTYLGTGRFGLILKTYAALFLIVLAMLPLLRRHGSVALIAAAAVAWAVKFLLDATLPSSPFVVSFFFGNGKGFGPSILPSLTFLAFGMSLGEVLTGRRGPGVLAGLLFLAAGIGAWHVLDGSVHATMRTFINSRWTNDPLYFAVGSWTTLGYLVAFWVLWRLPRTDPASRVLAMLGTQTLFVYGVGNIVLNLLPLHPSTDWVSALLVLLFLAVLVGLGAIRTSRQQTEVADRMLAGVPGVYSRLYSAALASMTGATHSALRRSRRGATDDHAAPLTYPAVPPRQQAQPQPRREGRFGSVLRQDDED